tara:strand:- start:126 stop:650 length:525 start_codon:yes stop_codon:yes gene_type:complete
MWTLVKNGSIVETIEKPRDMRIDGALHSSQIFTQWSDNERAEVGLIPVANDGQEKDEKFYVNTSEVVYSDGNSVRRITNTPKDVDSVKAVLQSEVNQTLRRFLSQTDWVVVRKTETDEDVPANIAKWRSDLRTKAAALESSINSKSSISDLEALTVPQSEGATPEFNDWPKLGS